MECIGLQKLLSKNNLCIYVFISETEFSSYSIPIDRELTAMIYCLTTHDRFLTAINEENFIQGVCDMIESEDIQTRREICRALTNIAQSPITRKLFLKQENLVNTRIVRIIAPPSPKQFPCFHEGGGAIIRNFHEFSLF